MGEIGICYDPTSDSGTMFYRYCESDAEAQAIVDDVQSVGGASLERDGNFVYVCLGHVDGDTEREALEEWRGYDVREV